jgi:hypothetical protein
MNTVGCHARDALNVLGSSFARKIDPVVDDDYDDYDLAMNLISTTDALDVKRCVCSALREIDPVDDENDVAMNSALLTDGI